MINTIEKQNLLMDKWKQEHINKGYTNFISDGILNYELWEKSNLKICFFLKEAYGDYGSLQNLFEDWGKIKYQLWHNVSYWLYGINHCYMEHSIPDFEQSKCDREECYKLLQAASVVNIKKSNGISSTIKDDLQKYLDEDSKYLLEELELINPDIIICGGTYEEYCRLNRIKAYEGMKKITDWTYLFQGKLVFDFVHPSAPIHGAMSYYTITGMFQKAKDNLVK